MGPLSVCMVVPIKARGSAWIQKTQFNVVRTIVFVLFVILGNYDVPSVGEITVLQFS